MQNDNQNDIFFFNDTATTEIYTLSLHDALPISGVTSAHRQTLANCWLWIANYHAEPRNTAPWNTWHMWQYCGDGKCDLRPRGMFPKSVANVRKAERNIFRGSNATLQAFWRENAWYPSG